MLCFVLWSQKTLICFGKCTVCVFYWFKKISMNGFNHWVQKEAVRKYVHDLTNTIYTLVWRTRVCLYKLVHICKEKTGAWGNDGWEWCRADRQQGAGTVKWMIDELTSGLVLKVGYLGNCIDYRYVVLLYVHICFQAYVKMPWQGSNDRCYRGNLLLRRTGCQELVVSSDNHEVIAKGRAECGLSAIYKRD